MPMLAAIGRREVRELILRLRDDGRTVLFSSDRTGIANVYAYDVAARTLRTSASRTSGSTPSTATPALLTSASSLP